MASNVASSSAIWPLPAAVEKCSSLLKKMYLDHAMFRPLPGQHNQQMHVREVYVACSLAEPDYVKRQCDESETKENLFLRLGKNVPGQLYELFEIFKPGKSSSGIAYNVDTVALTGPPGCGKTLAATQKLPVEWADDNSDWMCNVVLLFVIRARSLSERLGGVAKDNLEATKAETLADLLGLHTRGLDDSEVSEVLKFLRKNTAAGRVLIVVDGKN